MDIPQAPLAAPQFDALTLELALPLASDPEAAARRALERAIAQVTGTPAEGWSVIAVHPSAPGAYDLIPPPGQVISVGQGFELQYALVAQPEVDFAQALFETNLDNMPETAGGLESAGDWFADLTPAEQDPLWSVKLIGADQVWPATQGAGIIVGHPDSGYIVHPELDDARIRHDKERDIYDGDDSAQNPGERGGNHGLSTASVILSGQSRMSPDRFVVGVAPEAEIVPMRITRKGPPVFFNRSGPRCVRDAIYHALDSDCHVISMSMGGVGDRSLQVAIREAVANNKLVLAAAGNFVRIVVWPARYSETIAVAACSADAQPWTHSSRGPDVDVTAPGHNVWRAWIDDGGQPGARPSSGTSYAVATAAGAAVLWLAHHGRANLLQVYEPHGVPLNEVFRRVLKASCDPWPGDQSADFGAGIINVPRLLAEPLPDPESFAVEESGGLEAAAGPPTATEAVADVFDGVPAPIVDNRLSAATGIPRAELDSQLAGVEYEVIFHLVTNPELREGMAAELGGLESAELPLEMAVAPELSPTLRGRLNR